MSILGKWFGFGIEELYEQALEAYHDRDWDSAIERFQICFESSRDESVRRLSQVHLADAHAQLGKKFLSEGEYFGAIKNLSAAIQSAPTFPDLYVALAQTFEEVGDHERCAEVLAEALRINPRYASAIFEEGLLWYKTGKPAEGLNRAFQAMHADPHFDVEAYHRARRLDRDGKFGQALKELRAARRRTNELSPIHAQLGESYLRDRMYEEAEAEFRLAIEESPGYPDLHCKLGQALIQQGKYDSGLEELDIALRLNPRYAEAHAWRGVALKQLGMLREAVNSFESALEIEPLHQLALSEAGKLQYAS